MAAVSGSSDDMSPSVTGDLLQLFFRSNRSSSGMVGTGAIFRSIRSTASAPWPKPEFVSELDGPGRTRSPEISGDGKTIYWTSERRNGFLEVWVARRDTPEGKWKPPTLAPGMQDREVLGLTVTEDETLMIVESRQLAPSVGGDDLYALTRDDTAQKWGAPSLLSGISTNKNENDPMISDDGLVLYFTREDPAKSNDSDFYRATRTARGEPFGKAELLKDLNGQDSDLQLFISQDCRLALFSSERGGNPDLYQASR
jgi:Tol biopolymer transport system component